MDDLQAKIVLLSAGELRQKVLIAITYFIVIKRAKQAKAESRDLCFMVRR